MTCDKRMSRYKLLSSKPECAYERKGCRRRERLGKVATSTYTLLQINISDWLPFFLSKSSTMMELMVKMLNVVANVATAEMETSLKKFSQSWSFNDDAG